MKALSVKVDDATRARWQEAADEEGVSLSTLVRRLVDEGLEARHTGAPGMTLRAVAGGQRHTGAAAPSERLGRALDDIAARHGLKTFGPDSKARTASGRR